jgi:hypothetical protein
MPSTVARGLTGDVAAGCSLLWHHHLGGLYQGGFVCGWCEGCEGAPERLRGTLKAVSLALNSRS